MPFENFDEAVLANEKLSLEIPEEAITTPTMPAVNLPTMPAVKLPTMPEDISLNTVYVVDGVSFNDKTEAERYQKRRQDEIAEKIVKQLPQSHDNKTIFYEIWDQHEGKKQCHERHTNAEKAYDRMGKVTNYFPDKLWIDQIVITENADGTVDLDRQLIYCHKFKGK